jgi:hypothetical protein
MDTMNQKSLTHCKTKTLIRAVERMQETQKLFPPTSDLWQHISVSLNACFAELARRQKAGKL